MLPFWKCWILRDHNIILKRPNCLYQSKLVPALKKVKHRLLGHILRGSTYCTVTCNTHRENKISVAYVKLAFFSITFLSKTHELYRGGEHDPFFQMRNLVHYWLSGWQIWEQVFFHLLRSFNWSIYIHIPLVRWNPYFSDFANL